MDASIQKQLLSGTDVSVGRAFGLRFGLAQCFGNLVKPVRDAQRFAEFLIEAARLAAFGLLATTAISVASAADHPALTTLEGDTASLDDYAGRSVLLNFWATWCGPCRKEMPELSHLAERLDPGKAVVIGVAADETDGVSAFINEVPVAYPIVVGDPEQLFGWSAELGNFVQGLPFSVLLDGSGEPIWVKMGELDFEELEEVMAGYMTSVD